jgi:hypothetical protein
VGITEQGLRRFETWVAPLEILKKMDLSSCSTFFLEPKLMELEVFDMEICEAAGMELF